MDEFLEGAGSATRLGERFELIGLGMSLPSLLLAVGLIVFVWYVVRAPERGELGLLLRVTGWLGVVAVFGAVIELAGTTMVLGTGWVTDLREPIARGGLFRLVGGALIMTALVLGDPVAGRRRVRVVGWFLLAGSCIGLASFQLDGHTVTEGTPWLQVSMSSLHVVAASMWAGGVLGLILVLRRRRRLGETAPMTPTVARFSNLATLMVVTVAAAGVGMSLQIVDTPGDYLSTTWGRLLLLKVALVLLAVAIAAYNRFSLIPKMEDGEASASISDRLRYAVTVEIVVLVCVTISTVFLVQASAD